MSASLDLLGLTSGLANMYGKPDHWRALYLAGRLGVRRISGIEVVPCVYPLHRRGPNFEPVHS